MFERVEHGSGNEKPRLVDVDEGVCQQDLLAEVSGLVAGGRLRIGGVKRLQGTAKDVLARNVTSSSVMCRRKSVTA